MTQFSLNDWLQWGSVAAILIIVAATICRKCLRLRKDIKKGGNCSCGCSGCRLASDCDKSHDKRIKKKQNR